MLLTKYSRGAVKDKLQRCHHHLPADNLSRLRATFPLAILGNCTTQPPPAAAQNYVVYQASGQLHFGRMEHSWGVI